MVELIDTSRHLAMEELLGLRDGEGTAFAGEHLESCDRCRGELERLYQVRARLRALPQLEPPRDGWPAVAASLARRRVRVRRAFATLGLAMAATIAGVLVVRGRSDEVTPARAADVWVAEARSQDLGPMIHRTRELESLLESYRPAYRVYDAPTALAVSVLEDRIGLLDRMLDESRAVGANREFVFQLWDERVEALETLVNVQMVREQAVWR